MRGRWHCNPGGILQSVAGRKCCKCEPAPTAKSINDAIVHQYKRGKTITNLATVHIKDVVVSEGLIGTENDLRLTGRDGCTRPAHVDHFTSRLRPDPVKLL